MVAQGLGTGKQHHRPQAGRGGYNSLCTGAAAIQQPHQACRAEHQPDQSLGAQLTQAVVAKAAAVVSAVNIGVVGCQDGFEGGQQRPHDDDAVKQNFFK